MIMSLSGGKAVSLAVVLLLSFAVGCAGNKPAAREPLQKNWSELAENSQGHSPAPKPKDISVHTVQIRDEPSAKPLPNKLVDLEMRNTEIKTILRSLALGAGVNIVVNDGVKGIMSIDFKSVPWDQIFRSVLNANGLMYEWDGDILRVMTMDDMEKSIRFSAIQERKKVQDMAVKMSEPLSSVMIAIDYADAASLKENLQAFLSKDKDGKSRGSIRVDQHSNSLLIQAIREDIDGMVPIIEKIDKPTPQILIRANIVETSQDVARNLGIQWGGLLQNTNRGRDIIVTPGDKDFVVGFPVLSDAIAGAGGVASLGAKYGSAGGNVLDLQLQALQKDGKLNIVSSPSIITLDNQKALTESGERVPYVTTAASTAGVVQEVSFVDAVLRLEITPHVIDGINLKMKVVVKKDEVDPSRTVQGNPFITKKNTETVLIVKNGETIVISGLTTQRDTRNNSGVPFLKDIPLLGWLFRSSGTGNSMQDVLIFITPYILPVQPLGTAMSNAGQQ
jgi:type IV pilus assembly protein PilQ